MQLKVILNRQYTSCQVCTKSGPDSRSSIDISTPAAISNVAFINNSSLDTPSAPDEGDGGSTV